VRDFDDGEVAFLVTVANLIASCHRHHEAAKRQRLLVREIAHRSGNMLQFVTSIFNQTVRNADSLAEAKVKFEARLAQMSRSNLLISNGGWTKASVRELVAQTLEPFTAGPISPDVTSSCLPTCVSISALCCMNL
jgi:two-component sensor histidine kinase